MAARAVVERTREAGVRLALGGDPRRVRWTIARPTLAAVAGGAAAGIALAWAARAALSGILPELDRLGWSVSAVAAAMLIAAGCGATLVAARRVLRIDAARALER
jgi:ABC-type antimicrobial peptide transport system permease subunit